MSACVLVALLYVLTSIFMRLCGSSPLPRHESSSFSDFYCVLIWEEIEKADSMDPHMPDTFPDVNYT